jgi:hypothetical protein
LTGKQPFEGEGWTTVIYQIMNVDPEPPTKLDPSLPPAVGEVFARAMAKDPAKRTPDVRSFVRELREAFESGERTPAFVAPPRGPSPDAHSALEADDFSAFRDLAPRAQRRPLVAPLIAVVALLVAAVAVIAYLRTGRQTAGPQVEGTPVAMATAAPATEVPAAPATAPPPTRPVEKPTPRPQPTAPRAKPTAVPTVVPTIVPTTAPTPPPRAPTAEPAPRTEPTAAPAPPPVEANKPRIDVMSDPPGAEVLVDGVSKGRTPLRMSDLEPGSYEFEVRKDGYTSYRKHTELDAGSDYTMRVTLPHLVNSLRVLSQPPGVLVRVNGVEKGRTPLTLGQLPSGHYDVSGFLEGYEEQTLGVDLKDGELQEVRFTFGTR